MLRTLTFSGSGSGALQLGPLEDRAQHDPHLVFGEGGADAAAHAAAEGDPGVGVGLAVEEALGPELLRLGEEVLAVVQRGDRRQHVGARRQLVAADRERRGQLAGDVDDHRPRAQRLLDRRLEVVVLAGGDRLAQARRAPRRCAAAAPSPRRAPVAVVSWPAPSTVTSSSRSSSSLIGLPSSWRAREQQREHVVALPPAVGLGAAQGDLLVDELVERRARAEEARPGAAAAEVAAQDGKAVTSVDAAAELLDQPLEAARGAPRRGRRRRRA